MWQNHLNYPGSSALAIIIRQYRLKRTSNGTIIGLSGNVPIQPPVLGSNKPTRTKASPEILQPYIFYKTGIIVITRSLKHYYRFKLSKALYKT